jgi:outer membrane protein assembly factor BamA
VESPLFTDKVRLRLGWDIERLDFRQISPLIGPALQRELGLDGPERLGMYTQTLLADLRDNPLEPRYGLFAELRVDEGGVYAGGDTAFWRVTPEVRGYLPIPRAPIVIAARARAGRFFGDIPVTERYFSGGASRHRGFAERRLAPTLVGEADGSMTEVPIGGAELVETSLELRTRIAKIRGMGVGGVAFLDGGDCTAQNQLDLGNLHWAAGAGARLYTVIGAIRFAVGYRLNRTGPGNPDAGSHWAFHLSLGEAY